MVNGGGALGRWFFGDSRKPIIQFRVIPFLEWMSWASLRWNRPKLEV